MNPVILFLFLLLLIAFSAASYMLGVRDRRSKPSRREVSDLQKAEALIDTINDLAIEHAILGEPGGVIIKDEIQTHRRKQLR